MSCSFRYPGWRQACALVMALGAVIIGILYYGFYRQAELPLLLVWLQGVHFFDAVPIDLGLITHSLPSLVHALATVLLMHVVLSGSHLPLSAVRASVIAALLVFEAGWGHTDAMDFLSIGMGVLAAEIIWYALTVLPAARKARRSSATNRSGLVFAVLAVSGFMASASYIRGDYTNECARYSDEGYCEEYKRSGIPVYMTYTALRGAVEVQTARSPDRIGKVYLYGQYVFLNEQNEGIHVIDNADPTAPLNKGFIRIPGNTDIAIKGNYLYADSYIDLVTLDLNDPAQIHEINRQLDIFPYDAFQNIPYNISLSVNRVDPQRGVVVGYTTPE